METTDFDLIVIGAGSTGENVADRAAQGGLSVAIIEDELVGGDCSYWACMPSKALLTSGEALRAAQAVGGAREAVTGGLDVAAVLRRRDEFTSNWDDRSQVEWVEGAGLTLFRGKGRITAEREVTVQTDGGPAQVLRARHAVAVATGSEAAIPGIEGLRAAGPWTSRDATSAREVPESLVIIGGGVVACELATAFADLGSDVTVLARSPLLKRMEPFAGEAVTKRLRERGVTVTVGAETTRVTRAGGRVTVETGDGRSVVAAEVLVATGRRARTDDLGLAAVGLTDGEYLDVDDTMRVAGVDWLYAVGDVNNRVLLTHQGKYQARAAGDVIAARAAGRRVDSGAWGAHVATADHSAVPQVVFSDPQVAAVGLTAAAARDAGLDVRVVETPLGAVAGASLRRDGYEGTACMVVDEARSVVVGMTFVGADVAELLHAATVAVVGEVPLGRLWHAVPTYPTMSEVWLRLLEAYGRPEA
ncbi:NAD(P)/FAD-dependent oxidoreductase [Tessaracoccus sp. OS52]|uniref:dihydrolipoyl dehydrogenase family protein n=1 Tax=Tessaracoccus sp. OS52 TaxID=2886691 RepID=UPI001D116C11|nr:NAD(P)/FAD-dependent oxidoreductase [Tessaracoccus sp. OS52]MCC2594151.1 NAD(P)/FAD-dependent oxidoreductase [Tessaracoccus sp. OS52]